MKAPDRSDRGESLVELLVSIAILGIAVVAILGAVGMSATASSLHQGQATVQNVLHNWAEQLSDAPYTPCATPAQARAAASPTLPAGFTAEVTGVRFWNGSEFAAPSPCVDSGLQRITLSVVGSGSPAAGGTLDVTVRRPCRSGC
ncbi:MAG: type IV pilus modification PilV family protein [Sporichthyaceae bacterium]